MVDPIFDYQFRLILIGDSTVGKSSLLRSFTEGKFADVCEPTVGVDFFARLVEIKDGARVKLQLWDTAGQERFRSITRSYYRNSVGGLLVYDITKRASFEHMADWLYEARRHVEPHRAIFHLVGCKCDLGADETMGSGDGNERSPDSEASDATQDPLQQTRSSLSREVSYDEAKQFADFYGLQFAETSAKTGLNVELVFTRMARDIYARLQAGELRPVDGWEGIKSGFSRPDNQTGRSSSAHMLLEALPEKDRCC